MESNLAKKLALNRVAMSILHPEKIGERDKIAIKEIKEYFTSIKYAKADCEGRLEADISTGDNSNLGEFYRVIKLGQEKNHNYIIEKSIRILENIPKASKEEREDFAMFLVRYAGSLPKDELYADGE